MQLKVLIGFFVACCILIVGFLFLLPKNPVKKYDALKSHPLVFYEKTTFLRGVETVEKTKKVSNPKILSGIIPHHLLPAEIIADFYRRLAYQAPKTIIIIGPNHNELGKYPVLTSKYAWKTPYGNVVPDLFKIEMMLDRKIVHVDEKVLPADHAVAGSMSFIKYFLPDTLVVPLLLSGKMTQEDILQTAREIDKIMDEDTVLIAAVDFSHYLTAEEADKNDAVTLSYIKNKDYGKLISLNNDYYDSPPSIITLLRVNTLKAADKMKILFHENSARITGDNTTGTTSYFSIIFSK